MTIDVDILIETYLSLREYIPAKDRQEASDHIMSFLADSLGDKELTDLYSAIVADIEKKVR